MIDIGGRVNFASQVNGELISTSIDKRSGLTIDYLQINSEFLLHKVKGECLQYVKKIDKRSGLTIDH